MTSTTLMVLVFFLWTVTLIPTQASVPTYQKPQVVPIALLFAKSKHKLNTIGREASCYCQALLDRLSTSKIQFRSQVFSNDLGIASTRSAVKAIVKQRWHAVIGPQISDESIIASRYLSKWGEGKIGLHVSPTSVHPEAVNPWEHSFSMASDLKRMIRVLGQTLDNQLNTNTPRIMLVYNRSSAYSQALAARLREDMSKRRPSVRWSTHSFITGRFQLDLFKKQLIDQAPQGLFLTTLPNSSIDILQTIKRSPKSQESALPVTLAAFSLGGRKGLLEAVRPIPPGLKFFYASVYSGQFKNQELVRLLKQIQATSCKGIAASSFAISAFDATYAVAQTILANPSFSGIAKRFAQRTHSLLDGNYRFGIDRFLQRPLNIFRLTNGGPVLSHSR